MEGVPDSIVLAQEMYQAKQELNQAKNKIKKRGVEYAEAERAYRIALQQEMFKLRSDGTPATIIGDLARGSVAHLKFERDKAKEIYRSAMKYADVTETEISVLQSINKRHDNI